MSIRQELESRLLRTLSGHPVQARLERRIKHRDERSEQKHLQKLRQWFEKRFLTPHRNALVDQEITTHFDFKELALIPAYSYFMNGVHQHAFGVGLECLLLGGDLDRKNTLIFQQWLLGYFKRCVVNGEDVFPTEDEVYAEFVRIVILPLKQTYKTEELHDKVADIYRNWENFDEPNFMSLCTDLSDGLKILLYLDIGLEAAGQLVIRNLPKFEEVSRHLEKVAKFYGIIIPITILSGLTGIFIGRMVNYFDKEKSNVKDAANGIVGGVTTALAGLGGSILYANSVINNIPETKVVPANYTKEKVIGGIAFVIVLGIIGILHMIQENEREMMFAKNRHHLKQVVNDPSWSIQTQLQQDIRGSTIGIPSDFTPPEDTDAEW